MSLAQSDENRLIPVQELVSIEDDPELLRYHFSHDNLLMWPFVRHDLLFSAQCRAHMFAVPPRKFCLSLGEILRYVFYTGLNSPYNGSTRSDIVFFSSGVVNVPDASARHFHSRLYDHFARVHPDRTLIIEDSDQLRYHRPRSFSPVRYHDLIEVASWFASKSLPTPSCDARSIDAFVRYLRTAFKFPVPETTWKRLSGKLHSAARRLRFLHFAYTQLFRRVLPKIVFLEDGCYGRRSYIIKWAKDLGIATAECQHGLVSRNHIAYNYAQSIWTSEYRSYLPDSFLVFGRYWADSVFLPSDVVVVGNPYVTELARTRPPDGASPTRHRVLFVSAGYRPDVVTQLILQFCALAGSEIDCRLRPHPLERAIAGDLYQQVWHLGVTMDKGNLYDNIVRVDSIVGMEASTVLFEARALGRNVFVLNRPEVLYYIDQPLFALFDDAADLLRKLRLGNVVGADPGYFYNTRWEHAYRSFVDRFVCKEGAPTAAR